MKQDFRVYSIDAYDEFVTNPFLQPGVISGWPSIYASGNTILASPYGFGYNALMFALLGSYGTFSQAQGFYAETGPMALDANGTSHGSTFHSPFYAIHLFQIPT